MNIYQISYNHYTLPDMIIIPQFILLFLSLFKKDKYIEYILYKKMMI